MFLIEDTSIKITRGDSAEFDITVYDADGNIARRRQGRIYSKRKCLCENRIDTKDRNASSDKARGYSVAFLSKVCLRCTSYICRWHGRHHHPAVNF